jgi:hypothetical protein
MLKSRDREAYFDAQRHSRAYSGARGCDCPGCDQAGDYRAPRGRDRLNDYFWFCLDHVREYNKRWDYFSGMSTNQIEDEMRRSVTWDRPTWPLGSGRMGKQNGFSFRHNDIFDDIDPLGEKSRGEGERRKETPDMADGTKRALATLDLTISASWEEVRSRYRQLAKRYHPDANGGDEAAAERFKDINQAYAALKGFYTP